MFHYFHLHLWAIEMNMPPYTQKLTVRPVMKVDDPRDRIIMPSFLYICLVFLCVCFCPHKEYSHLSCAINQFVCVLIQCQEFHLIYHIPDQNVFPFIIWIDKQETMNAWDLLVSSCSGLGTFYVHCATEILFWLYKAFLLNKGKS